MSLELHNSRNEFCSDLRLNINKKKVIKQWQLKIEYDYLASYTFKHIMRKKLQ